MVPRWFGTRELFVEYWNASETLDEVRGRLGMADYELTPAELRAERQKLTRFANHLRTHFKEDLKFFRGGPGRHYNAGPKGPRGPRKPRVVETPKPDPKEMLRNAVADAKGALDGLLPHGVLWEGLAERLATLLHVTIVDAGTAGGRRWRALVVDQTEVARGNCWQRIVELLARRADEVLG